jgi:hypothetical protein
MKDENIWMLHSLLGIFCPSSANHRKENSIKTSNAADYMHVSEEKMANAGNGGDMALHRI